MANERRLNYWEKKASHQRGLCAALWRADCMKRVNWIANHPFQIKTLIAPRRAFIRRFLQFNKPINSGPIKGKAAEQKFYY